MPNCRQVEFDAFGVPKGERVQRFENYLGLIQRLWTEDRVSYDDSTCHLSNVRMNIRPVQKPRPPIWIAANNDPAVKRAARLGDAWFVNPHSTIDTVRRQWAVYQSELEAVGKAPPRELPMIKEVYCAKDRVTAIEMAGLWSGNTGITQSGGKTRSCPTTKTSPARWTS